MTKKRIFTVLMYISLIVSIFMLGVLWSKYVHNENMKVLAQLREEIFDEYSCTRFSDFGNGIKGKMSLLKLSVNLEKNGWSLESAIVEMVSDIDSDLADLRKFSDSEESRKFKNSAENLILNIESDLKDIKSSYDE